MAAEAEKPAAQPDADSPEGKGQSKKREIKGNLPYSVYPNSIKKALEGIISAERPDKFSSDFMSTVLKITGGSGRPVGPLLKKMQFISSDGTPTDLYSKFKSESARGQAALDGLRNAYGEMFRRNEFVHRAEQNAVKDLIVEITGLNKSDNIVRLIAQTFEIIRGFADKSGNPSTDKATVGSNDFVEEDGAGGRRRGLESGLLGLSYHINVVLPETENIAVFNAIFRSLRENLLKVE